jgi:hypothetical protein
MKSHHALPALLAAILVGGCLGKPEIEDRWTRLDLIGSNIAPGQTLTSGAMQPITVRTAITYRSIVTGFAVTELRASRTVSPADVEIHPNAPRVRMAQDIDRLLQNSVSVGRATRAITGWDHLIQEIDLTFNGWVPTTLDSAGTPLGPPTGLFLISYLGEGDEIELADGTDSLVVTPFRSTQYEILHIGMELRMSGVP